MQTVYFLKLVYRKIILRSEKIFLLRLFKIAANKTECIRLEQVCQVKFSEEAGICTDKSAVIKKIIYKWSKHSFATTNLNRKESSRSENTDSPLKKVPGPNGNEPFILIQYINKKCFCLQLLTPGRNFQIRFNRLKKKKLKPVNYYRFLCLMAYQPLYVI